MSHWIRDVRTRTQHSNRHPVTRQRSLVRPGIDSVRQPAENRDTGFGESSSEGRRGRKTVRRRGSRPDDRDSRHRAHVIPRGRFSAQVQAYGRIEQHPEWRGVAWRVPRYELHIRPRQGRPRFHRRKPAAPLTEPCDPIPSTTPRTQLSRTRTPDLQRRVFQKEGQVATRRVCADPRQGQGRLFVAGGSPAGQQYDHLTSESRRRRPAGARALPLRVPA